MRSLPRRHGGEAYRGRRHTLRVLARALLFGLCACTGTVAQAQPHDLILRNALIVDGSGKPAYRSDMAINGETIVRIAPSIAEGGKRVIDVHSQVVAPGFIDVHNHARNGIFQQPTADNLIRQGITTVIEGPDGGSAIPIASFLRRLQALPKSINIGTFIGHGSVREHVVGRDNRPASTEELEQMRTLVEQGMKDGAFGLSSGLIYVPGIYAPTSEIIALAKVAGRMGGHYQTHIRSESSAIVKAVAEAITIGEQGGLPTQITHHKAVGQSNWGKPVDTLRLIDQARARGIDVTIDQYPYSAVCGIIASYLPGWLREGTPQAVRDRLKDPQRRARAKAELARMIGAGSLRGDLTKVAITRCRWNETLAGKTVSDIARSRGTDGADAMLWLMEQGGCGIVVRDSLSEHDVERILRHPATMVASDGEIPGVAGDLRSGVPHPRSFGTFPRVLAVYVRERRLLTLEAAVRKMTALPARRLKLADRGTIREGAKADLLVFDPARVRDTATLNHPNQYPEGIPLVIVNGQVVFENGAMTAARPGKVLLGPAAGPSAAL